jgi:hypothetical protein
MAGKRKERKAGAMKLYDAAVCVECDQIVSVSDPACPCCTCTQFLPLGIAIDPMRPREEINLVRFVGSVES